MLRGAGGDAGSGGVTGWSPMCSSTISVARQERRHVDTRVPNAERGQRLRETLARHPVKRQGEGVDSRRQPIGPRPARLEGGRQALPPAPWQ